MVNDDKVENEEEVFLEKCSTCKYCKRYKQLLNRKWEYGYICTLFPDFYKCGEYLILENDLGLCEMYTHKE